MVMKFKDECSEVVKDKLIVLSENRSKITLQNESEGDVTKVEVDGCEIKDNDPKCDYLVLKNQNEYFVELKGQDIDHGIKQLKRSLELLRNKNYSTTCFIICKRIPLSATKIQDRTEKFRKNHKAKLIVKKSGCRYKI